MGGGLKKIVGGWPPKVGDGRLRQVYGPIAQERHCYLATSGTLSVVVSQSPVRPVNYPLPAHHLYLFTPHVRHCNDKSRNRHP